MAEDLPTDFDLIVIGTGLTESILAAAASRIGKSVLHIDSNDHYGGQWASFNLEAIQNLIDTLNEKNDTNRDVAEIKDNVIHINTSDFIITNSQYQWFVENETSIDAEDDSLPEDVEKLDLTENESSVVNVNVEQTEGETFTPVEKGSKQSDTENKVKWTKDKVLAEFRKFNIDLTPKLLFSRGVLVELLISSNICRYAEFRSVDRVTTLLENQIKTVPCSRSDVFTNKNVNVVEKRLLMKILGNCLNYQNGSEEFKGFEDKTFKEYLEQKRLPPSVIHYILYAISMSEDNTPCLEGIQNTKKCLNSLGRYGNTPYLFPMYGCGEIPQCFCRLCAVFGGIYCLKRSIEEIHLENLDGKLQFNALKCGEQMIKGKSLVIGNSGRIKTNVFNEASKQVNEAKKCGSLARAIYITNKPLGDEELSTGGGGVNILKLPSSSNSDDSIGGAYILQLSQPSGTCPKELYLIHLTCRANSESPKSDIEVYEQKLFNDSNRNTILCSFYFNIPACSNCKQENQKLPNDVFVACGPYFELDYDESINRAKSLFTEIYPEEEFLPRAPDPEELDIEDDHPLENSEAVTDAIISNGNSNSEKSCTEKMEQNEDKSTKEENLDETHS